MTEMTPGQAAAEEWHRARFAAGKTLWQDETHKATPETWDRVANVAVSAATPAIEAAHTRQLGAIASERDRYRELLDEAGIAIPAEIEIAASNGRPADHECVQGLCNDHAGPVTAVGDRVLITGRDHPWKGHTGTISGPFETDKDLDLKWVVALDDGWSTAAVAENDIRRVR
jgi:hypothetical protein